MADRTQRGALPNLIVIGTMKCGTTSLHHYLDLHPEIQMSRPKELKFFVEELNWSRGVDWYASHFDPDAPVRGESSPQYTTATRWEGVPARMRSLVPDAKLIFTVRDPIDRMVSHYLHMRTSGEERQEISVAFRQNPAYVDRSRYWMQLEPFLEHYPAGSIQVVDADELARRRRQTMRRVFDFLEVEADFTSREFDRLWETSRGKNDKFQLLLRTRDWPIVRNSHRLPRNVRWLLERIKYSTVGGSVERPMLEPALRRELEAKVREDAVQLRSFTGSEFASWSV
jgi:Sulfotransferase domain